MLQSKGLQFGAVVVDFGYGYYGYFLGGHENVLFRQTLNHIMSNGFGTDMLFCPFCSVDSVCPYSLDVGYYLPHFVG